MSLFSGIAKLVAGAAMIAAGVLVEIGTLGGGTPLALQLFAAGAGMVLSGIGTLLTPGNQAKGFATTTRNPIAPWKVLYGRVRTGGTIVYLNQWGGDNKVMDMVIVLAGHACEAVDELLFDQQRIQIDTAAKPAGAIGGTSFTPVQQTINITSIVRSDDVVTVVLPQDIPYLEEGDRIVIQNIVADPTLNGTFYVSEIISRVPSGGTNILTFTFLSGGVAASIVAQGQAKTVWADYGRTVYMESLLGTQTLGQTFKGMATAGTPWLGTGPFVSPAAPGPAGTGGLGPVTLLGGTINPWTSHCSLVGKTAVFLRLTYDPKYYTSGLPQISFKVRGKNDIYDPRLGSPGAPATTAYTENAALCIADHLHNSTWGFRAAYGTEIPTTELTAEANVCDQAVTLAKGGTEPRYACNGQFDLSMSRGEVLQNLLTSCAGRLVYIGGQFFLQAARWTGASAPAVDFGAIAAGPVRWRPTVSIRDLYNGVKGTYISPSNKWQATDFPYYAQDTAHGYSGPSMYGGDINLAADGGERRWYDIHLPFTISAATAQRIAKIELLRRRQQGTGTLALNMAGYQFTALDVVAATQSFLGWAGKLLEVGAARLRAEKHPGEGGGPESVLLGCELDVQETDSSVYQWTTTEELTPQGFVHPSTAVASGFHEQYPFPWSPGYAKLLAGDAVYPQGATGPAAFGLQPVYSVDAQENATAALQIKGTPPINALDDEIGGPQISCVASNTGGALPAGTYVVAVSAFDGGGANHANTPYLDVAVVEVGGSGAGSIAISITWGSGDDGGELYLGRWNADGYVFHRDQILAPGAATATVTAVDESTPGGPDPLFDHLAIVWQEVIHSGNWAAQVVAVTATTITVGGGGMTTNQWAGRILSLLAKFDDTVEIPVLNMPVSASSASSGTPALFTLTIGPNSASVQLPDLTTLLAVGDLVVMRFAATFTDTSFSDPSIANPYYPSGATGVGVEAGHVAVVLTGEDAGDIQTISDIGVDGFGNDTIFNLAASWKITPSAGDLVIICAPATAPEVATKALLTKNGSVSGVVAQPNVLNLKDQTWLFRVRTEDASGRSGPDTLAPRREVYLFGAKQLIASTNVDDGYFILTPDGMGNVQVDLANGLNQKLVLTGTAVTMLAPIFTGGSIVGGSWFALYLLQDATGSRAAPTYAAGSGGSFSADDALLQVDGRAGIANVLQFTYHPAEDRWALDQVRMGASLS